MRNRKRIAAVAVALAMCAWTSPHGSGQPRPPAPPPMGGASLRPPMGGGRPPGPVMGPGGGPGRPGGINGPGGIGGRARPGGAGRIPGPGGGGAARPSNFPGPGGPGSLAGSGAITRNSPTAFNRQALAHQASLVRNNYQFYGAFSGDWWGRHSGAWYAAGWATAAAAYSYPTWGQSYAYCGYTGYPAYYDYGSNVVYERQHVYVNGDAVATQEQYAQQATTIAGTGKTAQAGAEDDWLPLGVFAMTQGGQVDGNDLFQLAVNKSGVIRGNYYAAIADSTVAVYGSVDARTQRAAWTVGDRKEPVFEAGFANLTKPETTMLVHWGKDRTQQWTLVRMNQPAPKNSNAGAADASGVETPRTLPER